MRRSFIIFGYALAGVGILSGISRIVVAVLEGRGGDIYQSYRGLNFIPIGVLIFIASIPFFIVAARFVGWYFKKDEREFEEYLKNKRKAR